MEIYKPGFTYDIEHIGADGTVKSVERIHNIMPTVALNYTLGTSLKGESQFTAWYLGLFNNNYTPVASDDMTSFIGACGENTAYTGTGRKVIALPAISAGAVSITKDSADVNLFDFTTAETIRGAFITSSPTWDGTTGLLLSAILFSTPKTIAAGEALRVPLGFTLTSA